MMGMRECHYCFQKVISRYYQEYIRDKSVQPKMMLQHVMRGHGNAIDILT